jgi:hypothetical protein
VLKFIRSLPWGLVTQSDAWLESGIRHVDSEGKPVNVAFSTDEFVRKLFFKIWKVQFDKISLVADIAAGLAEYHPDFGYDLVNFILDDIILGLEEMSHYRFNQRRVC